MLSDRELLDRIEQVTKNFKGQADELAEAIGMVVLGNLVGWRVVRLVCSRRCWMMITQLFGDPKELLPERGRYAYKSLGLRVIDTIGGYWEIIRGSRVALPNHERKALS
jgi:hypothetical protein